VQVVEKEDEGPLVRKIPQERDELPLEAFRGRDSVFRPSGLRRLVEARRQLHGPRGSRLHHQAAERFAAAAISNEALERFQHRQVRVASHQPFGASPPRDVYGHAHGGQVPEKDLDEGGLADTWFTAQADEPSLAGCRRFERRSQRGNLSMVTDEQRFFFTRFVAGPCGRTERGHVPAFGDVDDERIVPPLVRVVPGEALPQAAHLDANDRVGFRIEGVGLAEDGDTQAVLLDPVAPAGEGFVHDEAQQTPEAGGRGESGTAQNALEVSLDDMGERDRA
jgi:hypothetical protein